ncbi:T9SS type A sorting domain-containing protein [Paucihalobacter sp.]|uniref:T9SS type A sorting domain-containing protein n=1 Tax=Paucihalobacter sp. TaxID=2850405 RepID=UPI002FE057B1
MKRITFLLITLCVVNYSYSQVVLSEDFESGLTIPAGWTNNDLIVPSNGEIWTIETGGTAALLAPGNTFIYAVGGADGNYAAFDSDGYGNNGQPENAALESPVFDASALTAVTLSFNSAFAGNFGGTGFVEVLNGDSLPATWVTVQTLSGNNYQGGLISLDVSAQLAGVTNAQVRFRWTGNWSVAWYVDNVTVFECTVSVPNPVTAVQPANGAMDVDINFGSATNNLGPIEWAPAATGDSADNYNISLGVNPAGNDIGRIEGFDIGNSINFNWQPNTTYYWFIEAVNCAGLSTSPVFSFTTTACTDIAAPASPTAPVPANGANDVTINAENNSVSLSWTGDPNASFTLNFGTTNPPTQSFDFYEIGEIITGLDENTEYFWSVNSLNCFGETTGTVWSFTTGQALSVLENELPSLGVYPNPFNDILHIKSNNNLTEIVIFDLLGKTVAKYGESDLVNSTVDLSNLLQGLYLMKITSGNKTQTLKITKK